MEVGNAQFFLRDHHLAVHAILIASPSRKDRISCLVGSRSDSRRPRGVVNDGLTQRVTCDAATVFVITDGVTITGLAGQTHSRRDVAGTIPVHFEEETHFPNRATAMACFKIAFLRICRTPK